LLNLHIPALKAEGGNQEEFVCIFTVNHVDNNMKKHWRRALTITVLIALFVTGHKLFVGYSSSSIHIERRRIKSVRQRHDAVMEQLKRQKQDRIIGGVPVQDGEFPFFAFPFGVLLCGATIVHVDVLLTAAHCAGVFLEGVIIGGTDLTGEGSTYYATDFELPHPDYDIKTDENDLMLVKLSRPTDVTPVQLNFDNNVPVVGEPVTVIGFGNTEENGEFSQVLLKTSVDIFPFEACDNYFGGIDNNTMLCAGTEEGGRDSCQGDSGGYVGKLFFPKKVMKCAYPDLSYVSQPFADIYKRSSWNRIVWRWMWATRNSRVSVYIVFDA
jgi:trypsin